MHIWETLMPSYLSPGVYIEEVETGLKPIEGVATGTAGFVGVTDKYGDNDLYRNRAIFISSWGDFVDKFGRYSETAPYMAPAVQSFFANGGERCYVLSVQSEDDIIHTGLPALSELNEVNVIAAPGMVSKRVQQTLITQCESLPNRTCILDSAQGAGIEEVQQQREHLVSDKGYGALYFPWVKMSVEKEISLGNNHLFRLGSGLIVSRRGFKKKIVSEDIFVPPSGAIAGLYARVDRERGVHKAPANEVLRSAMELEYSVSTEEQEILNPKGINCIRSFPGRGIRVWGARTLSSDREWKYVNVRRLMNYLEASISEGTQWAVFEPNNEQLWVKVKQSVENFLLQAWRSGALMGSRPDEAFFVRCDRTTMTQNDIENAKVVVQIGVAPLKPAEFMIFTITQHTG